MIPTVAAPYPYGVVGGVGEIDKVNAFGQVVERDFVGGVPTYAAPGVIGAPATTAIGPYGAAMIPPTTAVAPSVYNPYASVGVVGGVGEIDKVNAFGQVVERDFVGGVPTYGAPTTVVGGAYPYGAVGGAYPYGAPAFVGGAPVSTLL